jgi:hypothetical protein
MRHQGEGLTWSNSKCPWKRAKEDLETHLEPFIVAKDCNISLVTCAKEGSKLGKNKEEKLRVPIHLLDL